MASLRRRDPPVSPLAKGGGRPGDNLSANTVGYRILGIPLRRGLRADASPAEVDFKVPNEPTVPVSGAVRARSDASLRRPAVITSVQDWLSFLRDSHTATGFPLIVGGLALMLFGWRLWKVAVVLAFGVFGTIAAAIYLGPREDQLMYALGCGAFFALLSSWPLHYSVSALGGILGGMVSYGYLQRFGMEGGMLWGASGAALIACLAMSILYRRHVVILVTAFLGAALLLSGLMTLVMTNAALFGTFRSMAAWSAIVIPFLVLVPTVMSCFYQIAEVRRLQVEL